MTLLIGRDPRQHVEQERHCQVGGHHVDPDSQGQRREKREQVRILFDRFGEENRDAQVHEGHREVNTLDEKIKKIKSQQGRHKGSPSSLISLPLPLYTSMLHSA